MKPDSLNGFCSFQIPRKPAFLKSLPEGNVRKPIEPYAQKGPTQLCFLPLWAPKPIFFFKPGNALKNLLQT
jgi:hypothetical protein